jgi:hypothetical protein
LRNTIDVSRFRPPLKSSSKRTCGTVSLGGSALTAPHASTWRVLPPAL